MKRVMLALGLLVALFFSVGACKKQARDDDLIRAAIVQHLSSIGTLNMSAMDMDVRSVSVNGNNAHAEVEFRPKTGSAPGAGMQVAYNLEKRDGAWIVLGSQALGGMQHPVAGQNSRTNQNLPNFHDLLNPSGTPAQGTFPPGHPPVTLQPPGSQPGAKDQTSSGKPR